MKFADLHTHTKLCRHASGELEEFFQQARERSLRWYGISDHFPQPAGYDTEFRMGMEDFPLYRQRVREIQKMAESTGVEVLYAAEYDYVPGKMREVHEQVHRENFDYTLGSVHFVGDFAFDDPDKIDGWTEYGVENVWSEYVRLLGEFVSCSDFNIMAHADLPKVFSFYPADRKNFNARMFEVFRAAARKDICLELNTAGLRKKAGEIYPSLDLLKAAREAGMHITFGSDAHRPCDIGAGLADALELARTAGFRSHVVFQKRQPFEYGFDD